MNFTITLPLSETAPLHRKLKYNQHHIISLPKQSVFRTWESLVDYVRACPSPKDFNWYWILPHDYSRPSLMYYVSYRSELIHPARLNDWLLHARAVDNLPNQVVIQLLEKCRSTIQRADTNKDGYIEYSEFLRFVSVVDGRYVRVCDLKVLSIYFLNSYRYYIL